MTYFPGQTYYGPHDARLRIVEVDGDRLRVVTPQTLEQSDMTTAEMDAWKAQSSLRIYYPENFADRRLVAQRTDETVVYIALGEAEPGPVEVAREEWDEWRAALPG